MEAKKTIRVLIAKIGLDGHDVGAKVLIFWLRDQGMEVIYTGLRQSVEQVVEVALQEAVDVIGLSILSGAHLPLCRKIVAQLHEQGLKDVVLIVGGNIPRRDHAALREAGVAGVFPTATPFEQIVSFIRERISR